MPHRESPSLSLARISISRDTADAVQDEEKPLSGGTAFAVALCRLGGRPLQLRCKAKLQSCALAVKSQSALVSMHEQDRHET